MEYHLTRMPWDDVAPHTGSVDINTIRTPRHIAVLRFDIIFATPNKILYKLCPLRSFFYCAHVNVPFALWGVCFFCEMKIIALCCHVAEGDSHVYAMKLVINEAEQWI